MSDSFGKPWFFEDGAAIAATCPMPPCEITTWYDLKHCHVVVAHCKDGDPEHWLRIPDRVLTERHKPAVMVRFVGRWVKRLHDWERRGPP